MGIALVGAFYFLAKEDAQMQDLNSIHQIQIKEKSIQGELYIGNFEWFNDSGDFYWRAPNGNGTVLFDFRNYSLRATKGGNTHVGGIFLYPTSQRNLYAIPNDLSADLTAKDIAEIENVAGLPQGTIKNTNLALVLAEVMIDHSDPTGQIRWKSTIFDRYGKGYEFRIDENNSVIIPFTRNSKMWNNTIESFKYDYERKRDDAATQAEIDSLRKWLGAEMEKLNITDERELLPSKYSTDRSLSPTTTIRDDFTDSNGVLLSDHYASFGGVNQSWKWVNIRAAAQIDNNEGNIGSNTSTTSLADSALSDDDMEVEAKVRIVGASNTRLSGVFARLSGTSGGSDEDGYLAIIAGNGRVILREYTAGTASFLGESGSFMTTGNNYTLLLNVTGGEIMAYVDGASIINRTDATPITGNNNAGVFGDSIQGDSYWDDFNATDGIAPAGDCWVDIGGGATFYPTGCSRFVDGGLFTG